MSHLPAYDVIIIGAGSVGVPAAYYLACQKVKTLVIERLASPGQGSNKAAIGGVRATHSDPAKIRLCLRSLEIFRTWKDQFGQDIDWHSGGYCFLAYGEKEENTLKNLLNIQKSYGLNIDWLDREQILDRIPDLNANDLRGATLSPEDGYCSSLKALQAFYLQTVRAGVVFRFDEHVSAIQVEHSKIQKIITDKGAYSAPVVINAAGAWATQVGSMLGFDHPVQPDTHEAGITEPVTHLFDPLLIDIRPGVGSANIYFYQQQTGQFIFSLTPNPPVWGYDCEETSGFLPVISRRILNVMPRLANVRVRRTWRGLYPMTPDGFPIIGWSKELPGYLMAIGMCGQGFMLAPGVGELLARLVTQEKIAQEDELVLKGLSPYREFIGKEALK